MCFEGKAHPDVSEQAPPPTPKKCILLLALLVEYLGVAVQTDVPADSDSLRPLSYSPFEVSVQDCEHDVVKYAAYTRVMWA